MPDKLTKLRLFILDRGPQYMVGARAGISPARMSEYCNGAPITPRHLIALCETLDCDPEDIVGFAEEELTPYLGR